ncbi:MAG: tetratricopeptide repeat protein [Dongiaceae bacterium]
MALLGDAYLRGIGVPTDATVGRKLLEEVIAPGDGESDYANFLLHDHLLNSNSHHDNIRSYLLPAGQNELWLAQIDLSRIYRQGEAGMPRNLPTAAFYKEESTLNLIRMVVDWSPPGRPSLSKPPFPENPMPDVTPLPVATLLTAQADPELRRGYQLAVATSSYPVGLEQLERLAKAGNVVAETAVCALLWYRSPAEDVAATSTWCEMAAGKGYAPAELIDGIRSLLSRDTAIAHRGLQWLELAGRQGMQDALVAMASAYMRGIGVQRDPAKSLELIDQAVGTDTATGLYAFAAQYRRGIGVVMDLAKADAYLRRAAEKGNWLAQSDYAYIMLREVKTSSEARWHDWRNRSLANMMAMIVNWRPPARP